MDPSTSSLPNMNLDATSMDLSNRLGVPNVPLAEADSHPALDSLLQSIQGSQAHLNAITDDLSLGVDTSGNHHPSFDFSQTHHHHDAVDPNDPNAHLMSAVGPGLSGLASIPLSDFTRARESILEEHIPRVQRLAKNVLVGM